MVKDRLIKEMLLEDDDWELWGQRYLIQDTRAIKDGQQTVTVKIIAIFDSEQGKYIFNDHFMYNLEV